MKCVGKSSGEGVKMLIVLHVDGNICWEQCCESLVCERELLNSGDRYAVTVLKESVVFGHL